MSAFVFLAVAAVLAVVGNYAGRYMARWYINKRMDEDT